MYASQSSAFKWFGELLLFQSHPVSLCLGCMVPRFGDVSDIRAVSRRALAVGSLRVELVSLFALF
jgi:hypothetical protein